MTETIAGYRLERLLGRGAQGEVWLARAQDGREAALKLLGEGALADADARKRFEREAKVALALRHPNVVVALAFGSHRGRPFLVSEFVPGGSLADLLAREGRLAPERALALAAGILRGLEEIERAGLVHRDLKPANVLLDAAGTPKIGDLGLARSTDVGRTQLTAGDAIVGTPAYVAPEQIAHGTAVDIRADLYGLGVILYQCLTGELPFAGSDVLELLEAQLHAPPPDPGRRVPLPRALSALVLALLAKSREDRPASARAARLLVEGLQAPGDVGRTLADAPATLVDRPPSAAARTLTFHPAAPTISVHEADVPTLPGAPAPAAVRVKDEGGAFLFLHAAPELTLGRDGAPHDPTHVCLRLLPAAANAERSLKLSGRHCALRRDGERWCLRDLGSTNGTTLDGARLEPGSEHALGPQATLVLGGELELRLRLVPPPAPPPRPTAPSLLLERPRNGTHHRYLLVAAPIALDLSARPVSVGRGEWLVAAEDGALRWLAQGPPSPAALRPAPIQPADPKQ